MAMLHVYAVFDKALQAFSRPFFVPTRGVALRGFIDECGNPNSELAKHPSDYELHQVAEFDEITGYFNSVSPTELVVRASEFAPHHPVVVPDKEDAS